MIKLYPGKIKRLVLFGAPTGSGKSTFLQAPEERLPEGSVPDSLADFHELARDHRSFVELGEETRPELDNVCLHVDLTNPLRWWRPKPTSRQELLNKLEPGMFREWTNLHTYATQASTLDVVTFFVRREEHFRRWMGRAIQRRPDGYLRIVVSKVHGDSTHNSELHRCHYQAWWDYTQSLRPRSFHVVDGNRDEYEFIQPNRFKREIDEGYAS